MAPETPPDKELCLLWREKLDCLGVDFAAADGEGDFEWQSRCSPGDERF